MNTLSLKILALSLVAVLFHSNVKAQELSSRQIDALVQKTMKTFDVPGMMEKFIIKIRTELVL